MAVPEKCGHGKTFDERCVDCAIVSAREGLRFADRWAKDYQDELEELMLEKANTAAIGTEK